MKKLIIDEKETLYKIAVEEITTKYTNNNIATQAWYYWQKFMQIKQKIISLLVILLIDMIM